MCTVGPVRRSTQLLPAKVCEICIGWQEVGASMVSRTQYLSIETKHMHTTSIAFSKTCRQQCIVVEAAALGCACQVSKALQQAQQDESTIRELQTALAASRSADLFHEEHARLQCSEMQTKLEKANQRVCSLEADAEDMREVQRWMLHLWWLVCLIAVAARLRYLFNPLNCCYFLS